LAACAQQPPAQTGATPVLNQSVTPGAAGLQTGAEQLPRYLPLLQGQRVALTVNHTSRVGNRHLADTLLALGVKVVKIFAPEHGFRGQADAGAKISDGRDEQTGVPVVSLYGKNYKPTPEQLQDVDVVVFDIQDVGVRFYTYISTMHYVQEACAEQGKQLVVLDRPNPNGWYVDGPLLDLRFRSFVGMHPVPVVHGLTVGELAQMINGEGWLAGGKPAPLTVVPCQGYTHQTRYSLPEKPSPNLPNDRAIYLYPSLCLFEGTVVSVGRGTEAPFQMAGHPGHPGRAFQFTPRPTAGAKEPMHKDQPCYGYDYRQTPQWPQPFSLQPLLDFYTQAPDKAKFFNAFFTKLAGNEGLRQQIEQGMTEAAIRATWQPGLDQYKATRKKYLLYPDFE
jgi:uncharacterized protein YbbC (DUF1343 family)